MLCLTMKPTQLDQSLVGYLKTEWQSGSLMDAVNSCLEAEAERDFSVSQILTTLFTSEIPEVEFLKARSRIAKILSAGVKEGKWYRMPDEMRYLFKEPEAIPVKESEVVLVKEPEAVPVKVSSPSKQKLAFETTAARMNGKEFTALYNRLRKENPNERLDLSGINLRSIDFDTIDIEIVSNISFQNADFSNAIGDQVLIKNCDFTGANFQGIRLLKTDFDDCDLTNANLSYADLSKVSFNQTKLGNTSFRYTSLSDVKLPGYRYLEHSIDMSYACIKSLGHGDNPIYFDKIKLNQTFCDRTVAKWFKKHPEADKIIAIMPGMTLKGMHLASINFSNQTLSKSDFSQTTLQGVHFYSAKLDNCDFRKSNLVNCNFTRSELVKADFSGATLKGCKFSYANLRDANFSGANLTDVTFKESQVDGLCIDNVTLNNTHIKEPPPALNLVKKR